MVYKHDGFWQPMDTSSEFQFLNKIWDGNAPGRVVAEKNLYVSGILVSVVIHTFKRYEFLQRTLLSIINQTHVNLQIIVVSNGKSQKINQLRKHLMTTGLSIMKMM